MDATLTSALGLAAGALTTIAYVPQVYKTWQSKSSGDLSLPMLLLLSTGILLWLVYGWVSSDLPVILANGATLLLTVCLVVFKLRYPK